MRELAGEALGRRAARRQIAALELRTRRELTCARAAAGVLKRRVHDHTAAPRLAHGEREIAIIAVEEAVTLVEAADGLERRAAQAEADAIDNGDLLPRRAHRGAFGEAVDDRASSVPAVTPHALDAIQPGEPDVRRRE